MGNKENCLICGRELIYLETGHTFTCLSCGQQEDGYVYCPNGHYVCDRCHGEGSFAIIKDLLFSARGTNPLLIAEEIIHSAHVPMLGCEHAWIAAGALLVALKNHGGIGVTEGQIIEALNRTKRQAIGAYCGLTGVCGVAPAAGAAFSVVLGAACPKDQETAITMRVVSRIIGALAEQTGPCCCKNFVRTALLLSCRLAKEHLGIGLPSAGQIVCRDSHRHPHGCREGKCKYYSVNQIKGTK